MYRKAYILTLDVDRLDDDEMKQFHNNLTTAKGIINWWHHLRSTYIIILDNSITAKNVADYVMIIMPNKQFFVCELKLANHNGWLNPKAWEWINQQIALG